MASKVNIVNKCQKRLNASDDSASLTKFGNSAIHWLE